MSIEEKNWYKRLDPASKAAVVSLFLGWMMDVYDVFIVAYLGLVIARVYLAPYLGAGAYVQAVYAAGALTATLVARAVGAMVFGPVADKRGRKGPLTVTLLGYSLFTVLTAFTVELVKPFLYGASLALGVIALFVAFRIAAGIFLGGEWTVGAPYASELLPPDIRARATAFMQMGSPAGSLLAALVPFILTGFMGNAAFSAFGWKIAFVLGALPALLAVYVRRSLPESKVWSSAKQNKEKFKVDARALAQTFLISVGIFTVIYATLAFYGDYVTALYGSSSLARYGSFSVSSSFLVLIFMNATALFGFLLFGHVADAAGRKKAMLAGALGLLLLAPVVGPFWTAKPSLLYLILAVSAYGIFTGTWAVLPSYFSERYSSAVGRATGSGLVYNGNLLITGWIPSLVPVVGKYLMPAASLGAQMAGGMALFAVTGSVVLIAGVLLGPETLGKRLDAADVKKSV